MKKNRSLPIPFLVVILAVVLSVFTSLTDGGSRTSNGAENPLQVQTLEQERMATLYLRVMSWLSSGRTHAEDSAKANPQPAPAPEAAIHARNSALRTSIRLCTLHTRHSYEAAVRTPTTLN